MAAVVPLADQTVDLLNKLSLDSETKASEIQEPTKKSSGDVAINRSLTPLIPDVMDPAIAYYPNAYASNGYYYGGYDGTTNDWDDLSHGVYGDNGSVMYHGYGYAPYGPYPPAGSPVPTVGNDGQLYGAQHYQYPSPYFQPMTSTGSPYPSAATHPKDEIKTSAAADQVPLSVDTANGNSNGGVNGVGAKGNNGSGLVRPVSYQKSGSNGNGSYGRGVQNAYQDPRYGFNGVHSPIPWLDSSMYSDWQSKYNAKAAPLTNGNGVASRNQNVYSRSNLMTGLNTGSGYMNRTYQNKLYGQYGNAYRSGYGYGSNAYYSQNNGRGWLAVDNKYRPRGRGNGFFGYSNENLDGLNELNRGPRAKVTKNEKGFTPITIAVKGQNVNTTDEIEKSSVTPDREQFNLPDFPETYDDAKFFVIKSYSEDDVHKSIKYNVWSSTQNGNKKLDAAYQEAQQKPERCPVFLFFSVNTSGQFVGVAEMAGRVDFDKNLEYWQQDKWIGCFPVKWHIVKDVPNSLLKPIILEYNENKPVTNSRDTQEVKLEQGLQVIKIFKEHSSKQCILDDFEFYEDRQKRIQEKKAKQQQFQKQVLAIDDKAKEVIPPKSDGVVLDLVNEANPKVVEIVQAGPTEKLVGDVTKPAEKKVLPNGVKENSK